MFSKRLSSFGVFLILAAVGSGLLLAQSPQPVGTWVGVGSADNPFGNGAAVALTDGRTLIVGGAGPDGAATNLVATFDTATNQFAIAGTLLSARTGHTATLLKNGRVLVTGGTTNGLVSTDVELFDPSTGASTLVAQMPEPRRGHVAALLQSGRVLIAGGYTTEDVVLQSAFIFDPATSSISPTSGMNVARASASATSLIDGRVVIIGGTNNGTNDLRSAEIYDPALQSFTTASTQLSVAVRGHSAVLLPHNGSVLIAGGTSNGVAQAGADLFLPAIFPDPFSWGVGQFAPTGAMSAARSRAIAGPTATDGYAVVTGGGSNGVERYRFATIKTDKDDYAPGERALITGSGWQPNEQVRLLFQEDPAVHDDYELTVTADGAGNIRWDQWAPEQHDLNVRFYLMAQGAVSRAQTTFTDAELLTAEIVGTANEVTVQQGSSASFDIRLSASGAIVCTTTSQNPATVTVRTVYSLAANGTLTSTTPSGAFSFFAGAPQGGGGNCDVTWTGAPTEYTATATVSANAATPVGSYPITLSANAGTTVLTNPNAQGAKLEDTAATTITVRVVAPTNTPPVITEGASVTANINEDNAPTPLLTLNATDAQNNTLTWSISTAATNGAASASGTGTSKAIGYTPTANYNGNDSFVVQVSDGNGGVDTITVNVVIQAVNDAPSFTKGADVTVNEDSGAYGPAAWATGLSAGPANESGQTLAFSVTTNNNALFLVQPAVAANGTLTFTPFPNAFGAATVTVTLADNGGTANNGVDTSQPQAFTITVTGVNDVPSFTKGADVTVNEDSGAHSVAGWATVISAGPNESGQTLTFNITSNTNSSLFSTQPAIDANGTLTFTPAANAFGAATVTVVLQDNGGTANGGVDTSGPQTFTITVNSVNDAPSFTSGGNVSVNEDSGAYGPAAWATGLSAGPANEGGQTLSFNVTANSNPTLFSVPPTIAPIGALTFTPAANAFGEATITVTLSDSGGTDNGGSNTSAPVTFKITVTGVNDAPSFTSGGNVTSDEDSTFSAAWATAISAGPNESGQTLAFTVTNTNNGLFSVQPAIAANGTLTFTPFPNSSGYATVTVSLSDNGGTANGGVDTSASVTFTINVAPVNDAPTNLVFNGIPTSLTEGDSMSVGGRFTDLDAGDAHTVTIIWGDNGPQTQITLLPGVFGFAATHTYTDDNPSGTPADLNSIQVTVTDNGVSGIPALPTPLSVSGTAGTVTINNVTPTLSITAPLDGALYPLGTPVALTAPITDPGADTFTCSINWDDPASPAVETSSSTTKNCNKTHSFTQAGVYTIVITVNDDDQPGVTDSKTVMIIVYDPSAGFVTGGGTIWSPAGAYMANTALEGKANFGFVSKYQKGAKTPSGQTEFQFKAGDLNFHGDVYQWLVVSGAKAQYKGTGTLNGVPGYGFLLTATDGQLSGGGGVDRFRIKIVDPNGTTVVYDNVPTSLSDDIDASGQQNIQTGSIVIHSK